MRFFVLWYALFRDRPQLLVTLGDAKKRTSMCSARLRMLTTYVPPLRFFVLWYARVRDRPQLLVTLGDAKKRTSMCSARLRASMRADAPRATNSYARSLVL